MPEAEQPMSCQELRDLLYLLVTDEVSEDEAAAAYSHLAECPPCRAAMREQVQLVATLTSMMPNLKNIGGFEC